MTIDMSLLPAPAVVEPLDFETILATIKADVIAANPALAGVLSLESEPIVKLCEVVAYRELMLRARINNAAKSVMLAYATGSDLDHLAALLGVARLPDEDDARFRQRTQISLEGYSTAGPTLSYVFHALSASNDVRDVHVDSPTPGRVRIVVLATPGVAHPDGVPAQSLLDAVFGAVSADDVRPLCDDVSVQAAQVITYSVTASLICAPGPSATTTIAAADRAVREHVDQQFRLGQSITLSGLHRALRQPGVSRVEVVSPAGDDGSDVLIPVAAHQAARCVDVTVSLGGIDV